MGVKESLAIVYDAPRQKTDSPSGGVKMIISCQGQTALVGQAGKPASQYSGIEASWKAMLHFASG
jgi:hypothetical protein